MFSAQDLSNSSEDDCPRWNFPSSTYEDLSTYYMKHLNGRPKAVGITISPCDKWYNSTRPCEQLDQFYNMLLRHADRIFKHYIFTAGLNHNGNIHIHGAYIVSDTKRYYDFWLPRAKRLGIPKYAVRFNKCEVLDTAWFDYLIKNADECIGIGIEELPIIIHRDEGFIYVRKLSTYTRLIRLNKRKRIDKEKPVYTFFSYDDASSDESIN